MPRLDAIETQAIMEAGLGGENAFGASCRRSGANHTYP